MTFVAFLRMVSITLLAMSFDRYEHFSYERIYDKFIDNSGEIVIEESKIRIDLIKKRKLPLLFDFFKIATQSNTHG